MDSILSFTTLIAATINFIWHLSLEGFLGVIIAVFIIKSAVEMLRATIDSMIGERADKELTDKIKEKVCSYEEVHGAYDLTLHNYGPSKSIATVHIQVRDDMTAQEIHIITRQIANDIFNEFGIITTVGIYAENDKGEFAEIKKELVNIIGEYKHIKQLHGFYVDKKSKNIYFDLIIDFECDEPEKIRDEIIKKIENKYPEYKFNVMIDADMTD